MNAIDTNVWVYCHDERDLRKQRLAQQLVDSVRPVVLLWQVGCEFLSATRKLEPFGFSRADAWDALADMRAMATQVVLPKPELWDRCRELQNRRQLQFWDGLIIVSCTEARVARLYSEDLSSLSGIDGLEIVNPFL